MSQVPIENVIDVTVSLGTQPIATATFDSAVVLADLTDVAFPSAYKVYDTLAAVAVDFADTTPAYKMAALSFDGNFKAKQVIVVKYRTAGTPLTPVAALTALLAVNSKPYYILCDTRVEATRLALAAFCEAEDKLHVNSTQEAGVLVPATTTDLGSKLQDLGYNNTFTIYSATANTAYSEGGVVGAFAAIPAGTSSLEFKTMAGVAVDTLDATQRSSCEGKNVAYYATVADTNCVLNSKVASGQFLDTVVFSHWLSARIKESLFGLLKRKSDLGLKVSYDDAGFAQIRQAIQNVINVGLANGSISPDVTPVVRTPEREDILEADRANRILPDVIVEVLYTSAVHKVLVRAYVTI